MPKTDAAERRRSPGLSARRGVGVFVVGFLVAILASPALAGTSTSSYGYYSLNGESYKNRASVVTTTWSGPVVSGTATVESTSTSVAGGWMGVKARAFNDGGALVCSSSYSYNSSTYSVGQGLLRTCSKSNPGTDNYKARGLTRAWGGTSYTTYATFNTPYQSL